MTTTLLGFALAATLLILAPGPDSLLVMRNTLRGDRRTGWITAAGTVTGLAIWAVAAALGLTALVQASHLGYTVLRCAGAAYLIWLGLTSLRVFHRREAQPETAEPRKTVGGRPGRLRAYANGVTSNLCNPKIGVFFVAFLPGFIPTGSSTIAFSLLFGAWFVAETGAWLACLAWLIARGVHWMRHSRAQRWLEQATGTVLIGFGIALAIETG